MRFPRRLRTVISPRARGAAVTVSGTVTPAESRSAGHGEHDTDRAVFPIQSNSADVAPPLPLTFTPARPPVQSPAPALIDFYPRPPLAFGRCPLSECSSTASTSSSSLLAMRPGRAAATVTDGDGTRALPSPLAILQGRHGDCRDFTLGHSRRLVT